MTDAATGLANTAMDSIGIATVFSNLFLNIPLRFLAFAQLQSLATACLDAVE
jgi:hypothetical protein